MEDLKRPTREETDEDLIQQQELFLKNKNKPIVNITRKNKQESSSQQTPVVSTENEEDKLVIQEKIVVFDVKERDVCLLKPFTFETPVLSSTTLDDLVNKKIKQSQFKAKKTQSIFAQLLEKKPDQHEEMCDLQSASCSLIDGSGLSNERPDVERESIHKGNLAKISNMSKDDILQHQNQLKKNLDPNILKFIQNKRNLQKRATSHEATNKKAINSSLSSSSVDKDDQSFGKVLRKEGKSECDALILERAMKSDTSINQSYLHDPASHTMSKQKQIPEIARNFLEGNKKGLWRNMNKIEKEKLEWMSDLPKPNPVDIKTGFTARFDFEGKLLAHDIDVPTYKGLHHHGDEPQVAGYSLEELFLLARSTMQSQRITALHTLAHILDNYWYGMMDDCFDTPLLLSVLEAGIVPLLRWALDDTSVTSVAATVTAIHSLLVCKPDELCLQRTFCWLGGHIMPQLEPQGVVEPNIVIEELTDADLIKLDVVKAFLRMDILPRFLYILQAMQPPPLVCKLIIEILAHLAQHSLESAKQVVYHPRLLSLIIDKFLPLNWQFVDAKKLDNTLNFIYPMSAAMKLIRIIVSSSRELATHIVEEHDLVSNIIVYLTLQPNDGKVFPQDMQEIMIESLKTFHVLLCYGMACDMFLELFPVFLKQMDFCLSLNLNSERAKCMQDFEYASHLFKVFEAVAAASVKHESESPNAAISAIFSKSLICLKKWLWQFPQDKYSDHGMILLSTCMNFVSTYYEKLHNKLVCTVWKPCSETKEVFDSYFIPCLKSKLLQNLLGNLSSCSILLNPNQSGNKRSSKTLLSLESILWKEDIVPVLKEDSAIPLVLSVLRLCILQKMHFNDCNNQLLEELLCNKGVTEYLQVLTVKKMYASNWFAKYERNLIFQILKLASLVTSRKTFFWYKIAVSVLPSFTSSEECFVKDIFESIIFNPTFLLSSDKEMHKDSLSILPVIANSYTISLLDSDALIYSRNILSGNTDIASNAVLFDTPPLLSTDWCYKPITEQYYNLNQRKPISDVSLHISNCLLWIHICHDFRLPPVQDIPGAVDFYYLCIVFLLDEDLFRSSNVQILLKDCLLSLLNYKSICLEKLDWLHLKTFDDIYLEMLTQFEAVSYGDQLFGNFILFPLQQCYPSRFKELLLTEHSQVIQFLKVPFSELLVPLQNYLEPMETKVEIVLEYCKILLSGTLNQVRCPVLYLMAVHHINHFLFDERSELAKAQKRLLSIILQSKNKNIQQQLLLYSGFNTDLECSVSVKNELSAEDERHLSNIMGHPLNLQCIS